MALILTAEERGAYAQGRFWLDCPRMQLRAGEDWTRTGAGYIRQEASGRLEYVMFAPEALGDARVLFGNPLVRGASLGDFYHADLEAIDVSRRTWRAERVTRFVHEADQKPGVRYHGDVHELRTERRSAAGEGEGDLLYLVCPEALPIPCDTLTWCQTVVAGETISSRAVRDRWRFSHGGMDFAFHSQPAAFDVIVAAPVGAIASTLDTRLEEALWIAFARYVTWSLVAWRRDGLESVILTPQIRSPVRTRFSPLLDEHVAGAERHLARIIGLYLEKTGSYAEPRYYPLAVYYKQVLLASSINLEAEALALGTAVEGILRDQYGDLWQEDASFLADLAGIGEHLRTWVGSSDTIDRVIGLFERLEEANAETVLKGLVGSGLLDKAHLRAWRAVRHTFAHGKMPSSDFGKLLTRCSLVYQLLMLLILNAIGYDSVIVDQTQPGHHLRQISGSAAVE